jgi:transcriptional regulator with XRE-family HTH domain
MTVARQFGANLARHRKDAGLSQEEVSYMAGVHRTEISQLERGFRVPRIDTLVKLTATVRAKPEDLLEGIAWEPGTLLCGRFVEVQGPGLGAVQRKVSVERPSDS